MLRKIAFVLFQLFVCFSAQAEESEDSGLAFDDFIAEFEESKKAKPIVKEDKTLMQTLDQFHSDFTEEIVGDADRIDSFFINERVTDGHNQTNLRIINTASMVERNGFNDKVDFRFRLRLPKLEEKVQFEVGQQVEQYSANGANSNVTAQNSPLRNQDRTARAGFSFFKDFLGIRSKLTTGVRYKSGIVPYGNFRLSRDFVLSKKSKISLINDLSDDLKDRSANRTTLYLDYAITKPLVWRLINEASYRDLDYTFQTINGFAFFHELSPRRSVSYIAVVNGINPHYQDTFYASSYNVSMTYRQLVYRDYVYFEYAPGVSFPRSINYHRQMEFYFRIEIIFGKI